MKDEAQLNKLVQAAGIQMDWTDVRGNKQKTSSDNLRLLLEALDLPCGSEAQCKESMAQLQEEKSRDVLPPLITARAGIPIRLPRQSGLHGKRYRIEFEEGGQREGAFLTDTGLPLEIAPITAFGYHRLRTDEHETVLAVAPPRAFTVSDALASVGQDPDVMEHQRLWGLAAQLYSLRQQGDGGIGHFGALATLATSAARHGASALAISPVHAMFSADRNRFSPYSPSSRLFLNVLHIDPAAVLGPEALRQAIAVAGPETADRLSHLEQLDLIDWPSAAELRLRLLRLLYQQFRQQGSHAEFERFKAESGEALSDHARYEAISAHIANSDWRRWRDGWSDPRSATVGAFAQNHASEIEFHLFLQWQAARGLASAQKAAYGAGMQIGLIADLAIGADIAGSQAWSRQDQMLLKLSIGAPPDLLNAQGQNWGLGALSPRAMRSQGFASYIEMLRAAFAYAGGIRIDHVLGLKRLWLVPQGGNADQGAYLRYPQEDLLRLIALESWRHRAIVIGEDLGTVPPGFSEQMAQAGLLGINLLWFQRAEERFRAPGEWTTGAVATTTTHDLPTVAGWWEGRDIAWRSKLGMLEEASSEKKEQAQRGEDRANLWQALTEAGCAKGKIPAPTAKEAPLAAAIRFVGATPAPLAILPMEDALSLPEQPNLPGTIDEHPNWRRRLPGTVDGLLDEPAVKQRLSTLHQARRPLGEEE